MIRKYRAEDTDHIIAMIKRELLLTDKEINDRLTGRVVYVFDEGRPLAVASVGQPYDIPIGSEVAVWLYVDPRHRNRGIGRELWIHILPLLLKLKPTVVATRYRSDIVGSSHYFSSLGFKTWFCLDTLEYTRCRSYELDLDIEKYEDNHFDELIKIINGCFEGLRKKNNIKPYKPYPEGFNEDEARQEWLSRSEDTFLFCKDDALVGLGVLDGNSVDIIAINPIYRRKGYGREITQFCFNELDKRGYEKKYISVLENNNPARNLYDSMGCRFVEKTAEARLHWHD